MIIIMKNIKSLILASFTLAAGVFISSSCNKDPLDLAPIDYYGSGSYWTTEAQVDGYLDGLHKNMRDQSWTHTITLGELRGGIYFNGAGADGTTTSDGIIIDHKLTADQPGISKFGDYYGRLTNVNLFIDRVEKAEYIKTAGKKNFYLGIAYGLRAFYYFDLYRTYGGVPLRLDVAVIDGETDPQKLYMERAKPSQVMTQIKADLKKSLEYFGNENSFDPFNKGAKKSYWSKAATEALAAEVYLWNAKVTIGDQAAVPSDVDEAEKYCDDLIKNFGLKLENNFADVFSTKNKGNNEIIFAIRFMEGESTNSNLNYLYLGDSRSNTRSSAVREEVQPDGSIKVVDWGDPCGLVVNNSGIQNRQYTNNFFLKFDRKDSRRNATFLASYQKTDWDQKGILTLRGSHVVKNIGSINAAGARISDGDYIYYRLPEIYLMKAEIANYKGDWATCAEYINKVRTRAYGANFNEFKYSETNDFTKNELAILQEKDFEFVQEGQRWWDINRMTLTKAGEHLVFCKEANPTNPDLPVLSKTEAHKVLWPLDTSILGNDPKLEQTPGY